MGTRFGLDAVAKRRIPCIYWESKAGRPARSLVIILTELSELSENKWVPV